MASYALLLHHAPDRYSKLSEDEAMAIFKDYMEWMQTNIDKGICTGGNKLKDVAGVTLRSDSGNVVVADSPFTEMAEILGGLMFIEADSMEAAIEIAKTHPHLVHNDHLEVRELAG